MIRSMTGFGRASFRVGDQAFEIEVRSVNHRYLDLRVRLPRLLSSLEPEIRTRVQANAVRGKVDLSVTTPEGGSPVQRLEIDTAVAREYLGAARQLHEEESVAGDLDVATLLTLPGVARFAEPELPGDDERVAVLRAVESAVAALDEMRVAEGAALERELQSRLDRVASITEGLAGRSGVVQQAARERLRKRAEQLRQETGILDEARLHQEVVIAADRLDVTEELVRLRSHVEQFRTILGSAAAGAPVGRRLDFLLQELGRETNTVGSKAADAPIAHDVVELKTELERMREQVQNVE